jgi:hypothetical protein
MQFLISGLPDNTSVSRIAAKSRVINLFQPTHAGTFSD